MAVFFTSDQHFGHAGIISFVHRPYESVEQMNEDMIARYNAVVTKQDDVYMLGDVAFSDPRPIVARLNGRKHLILGNHDQKRKSQLHGCAFQWIKDVYELEVEGQPIWLSHYPHRSWPRSFHGSWHLHGHTHGVIPNLATSRDVGVDCWGMAPVSFETLKAQMAGAKLTC